MPNYKNPPIPNEIISKLREWVKHLEIIQSEWQLELSSFDKIIGGTYLLGSLVNLDSDVFDSKHSDVDLLIIINSEDPIKILHIVKKIKKESLQLETDLRSLLKRRKNIPILSITIATDFEVKEGIHKNRNTIYAFSAPQYIDLKKENNQPQGVGDVLKNDTLTKFFPIWTILAKVQEFRCDYLYLKKLINDFNDQELNLPKDILRNIYFLKCIEENSNFSPISDDDRAIGSRYIQQILDDDKYKNKTEYQSLINLLQTHRPNGIGKRSGYEPVKTEDQLLIWEIIGQRAKNKLIELHTITKNSNLSYASETVFWELVKMKSTSFRAVGDSIELYSGKDIIKDNLIPLYIEKHENIECYEFNTINSQNIQRSLSIWPENIKKYLDSKIEQNAQYISQAKIGFAGANFSQVGTGLPIILKIRPLSYWTIENFNNKIASLPNNRELKELRDQCANQLLKETPTEDFICNFPSQLFLELALITKDGIIPELKKNSKHSRLARGHGGPISTCGPEFGFLWKDHIKKIKGKYYLDIYNCAKNALHKELNINIERHVENLSIHSICIQDLHLNSAVVGIAKLNITFGDFLNILPKNGLFFEQGVTAIPINKVSDRIKEEKNLGSWHQTGLLRLNLVVEYFDSQ